MENEILYGPKWVTILGCNLPEEEIRQITGWTNYQSRSGTMLNNGTRMLKFLVEELSTNRFFFWTFFISNEEDVARSGKKRYIDEFGNISFYTDYEPDNMVNCRVAYKGEVDLTKMLQIYINYIPTGMEDSWMEQMYKIGASFEDLMNNRVEGLNRILLTWAEHGERVGCLFTEKNGYQNIETHYELMYNEDPDEEGVPAYFLNKLYKFATPGEYNPIKGNIDLSKIIAIA